MVQTPQVAHSKGPNLQCDGLQPVTALTGNERKIAQPSTERLPLTAQTHWQKPGLSWLSLQTPRSPTLTVLEQYMFANLPVCTGCDPPGHLKGSPTLIRICIIISIFTQHVFLQPFRKNTDGFCKSSLQPASPAGLGSWNV